MVLLLRRWCPELWGCGGDRPLERPRALARFVAALVLGTAVGAALAVVGWTAVTGSAADLSGALWFGRTLCSTLTIVALGVMIGQRATSEPPRPPLLGAARTPELLLALVFTAGMYALAFWYENLPLAFPLLAATVWFGMRFSTLLTAALSFVTGIATLVLTLRDIGPFAAVDQVDVGYLLAEFYVATIVVTGLGLSTGRDEREALTAELRRTQAEAEYQASVRSAVIGSMNEGLFVIDDRGAILLQNPAAAEILGVTQAEMTPESIAGISGRWADGTPIAEAERPALRPSRARPCATSSSWSASRGCRTGSSRSRRSRCLVSCRAAAPRRWCSSATPRSSTRGARTSPPSPESSPTTCATRWPPSTAGPR